MTDNALEKQFFIEAAFKTAEAYYYGNNGVVPDHKRAALWYRKAAEKGHVRAQYMLGKMYAEGDGVRHLEKVAAHWLRQSALQGDGDAQMEIVDLYVYACPDSMLFLNRAVKIEWFVKAAETGDCFVQFRLAEIYEHGELGEYNEDQALFWFKEAAKNGHSEAKYRVADYLFGLEDDANGIKYLLSAAADGFGEAQYDLACLYDAGDVVSQDYHKAIRWYREAANQAIVPAQARLAMLLEKGLGCEKDLKEAEKWYWEAATLGDTFAACHIASLYREGKGCEQNSQLAAKWFRRAIDNSFFSFEQGPAYFEYKKKVGEAKRNLGLMHLEGDGVNKDEVTAYNLIREAAEIGDVDAQYYLAVLLEQGRGTKRNCHWAATWYKRASEQGHNLAKNALACLLEKATTER